ncbi:MAG: hypothetical protein IPK00_25760 [Deltaproteobacteria bacterium]|nr:hypothetical protein [Deltaproteobacteria bacterium]
MVVDTGADQCFVDHRLAYTIGINPVDGGVMGTVVGVGSEQPTARYPVDLFIPAFGLSLQTDVCFSILNMPAMNGLLGHEGFLNRFRRVTFRPGDSFELELR